jgi:hypothetical protein
MGICYKEAQFWTRFGGGGGMTCHCLLANERPVFGRAIIAQAQALGPVKISFQGWPYIYFQCQKINPLRGHQDAIFSGPFRHQNAFTSILIGLKTSNAHPGQKVFLSPKMFSVRKKQFFFTTHPRSKKQHQTNRLRIPVRTTCHNPPQLRTA